MTEQLSFFTPKTEAAASLLGELLYAADALLVKKLSNNDRDWAQLSNKHQAGVYVPPAQRDGGFFPPLAAKEREGGGHAILETFFETTWPQVGEKRRTRLVNYTSKGAETHLTGLPKAAFSTLSPASFLVMAVRADQPCVYWCLTFDACSDDALVLEDLLELGPDFTIGVFEPQRLIAEERNRVLDFAEELAAAWTAGSIARFAAANAAMPPTTILAELARKRFLEERGLSCLDPFELATPGDAVREISRGIEWELFREFQRRERAVEVVRAVLGDAPTELTPAGLIRGLVNGMANIDRIMLSASQQRKSRAGYSFEHQIEAMLVDGKVPFAKQVVMEARKRPDFVLPSLRHLKKVPPGASAGLILSAKTTLRERWKQVQREMGRSDLFLATVDESIAANAIEDMSDLGIILVVPESLKRSDASEYVRHGNVMDFRTFFRDELAGRRMPAWPES